MRDGNHKRNQEHDSSSNSSGIWFYHSSNLERYHSWDNDTCRTLACDWTNNMDRCSLCNNRSSGYNTCICSRNHIYLKMGWRRTKVEPSPFLFFFSEVTQCIHIFSVVANELAHQANRQRRPAGSPLEQMICPMGLKWRYPRCTISFTICSCRRYNARYFPFQRSVSG